MDNSNTYEKDYKKLEEIVKKLELGDISLDESVKLYEEGVALYKSLEKTLKEYEGKINVMSENLEAITVEDLDEEL